MKKSCWNTWIAKEDELSDEVMEQVLCATAMGQATMYQGDGDHIIACIPTETVKQFRRRTKSSVFLLKTRKSKTSTVLMGCAILSKRGCKKGTIYLHDLYVRPKYRRKGVATGIVLTGGLEARKLRPEAQAWRQPEERLGDGALRQAWHEALRGAENRHGMA